MTQTFDQLLDLTLQARTADAVPANLEQRLLAALPGSHLTAHTSYLDRFPLFSTHDRITTRRGALSSFFAIAAHAMAAALLFMLTQRALHTRTVSEPRVSALELAPPPPALPPRADMSGGGGGQSGAAPVTQGHLPRLAPQQLLPPKAPVEDAKLTVDPSIDLHTRMSDNKLPDLGVPDSALHGYSMGNGHGSGIGSGDGDGMGPGSGGNTGGGPMHIGGGVRPPAVLYQPEAEFSEEARKAKFSGNVQVYLWVDEQGNPSHVKVVRPVGLGLDEKAIEAVRQYKFKPATKDGKPVKVDLYIDVDFRIF